MRNVSVAIIGMVLVVLVAGCDPNKDEQKQTYNLPDVSTINAARSDTFIVSAASLTGPLVTGIMPMPGSSSNCYHPGSHVVFASTMSVESVDIISPVDGVVTYVSKCYPYGALDQYKIHIAYAQRNGELFELELGMEPMAQLCSGATGTPGYYDPYISVAQGERVARGQKVGAMVLAPGSTSHIHFNSKYKGIFMCPDIFASTLIDTIDDHYQDNCNGVPLNTVALGTICYQPGAGESHADY